MKRNLTLAALAISMAWLLVNLEWIAVGAESFTGGQVLPALNLIPAIALTALFIALYGKLRRTLLGIAIVVMGLGIRQVIATNSRSSAVVVGELERISGIQNPDDHMLGVEISTLWAQYGFVALAFGAIVFCLLAIIVKPGTKPRATGEDGIVEDNRSLWDEQSS